MNETIKKEQELKSRSPACAIFDQEEGVVLHLEMPGVTREGIEIKVEKNQLQIVGTPAAADVEGDYLVRERRQGIYRKTFTLDDSIDRDRIEAVVSDGVLTLGLNFREAVKPKRIQIKGS